MSGKLFETTDDGEFVFRFHRPRIFDDETRGHLVDAQKHALKAARSMVDAMLSAMEKGDDDPKSRRQNINID